MSPHQWRQLLELELVLFFLTIWISDCHVWLTQILEIRMNSLSVLFKTEVHLPILRRTCSNLELIGILLIIWIAVMVYLQYFIINFLFQEANFSPHQWSQLLELVLVLILLIIWISGCLSLAHIVKIRMNSLSVLFRDGSSSSFFSR